MPLDWQTIVVTIVVNRESGELIAILATMANKTRRGLK